ncbi:MAG: NADH-quinone oxidoreductase subunit NuoE [Methanothrix soehngenii]|jgi:NADH-quinone oxidoreductase subunit E|uniref:NADH-quinone oxidoreductase subunit NuoE n=1 Tax=Methanothrix soehngenii TaxID=2223 RepID=UPI0023F2EFC8|nr:NADH-quinone oxidoreductase subunit NuoE [Methanothrix soehngenii]MCK9586386.1 NADH-quinone oxidoreductase subunit NuoE [Methanothrix soehngenii]MDD3974939.1 NADH-quinone oxidoreductase subunit NuoE [Methanothrix soehngenii]MDD5256398.1 NADH-quinone oxidoreductase subunit NuoE [Methanothrix soehngenii]
MQDNEHKRLVEMIDGYKGKEGSLIQLLLDLQSEFNWISKDTLQEISERLKIPRSRIYRIASFYEAMSLRPIGKHKVSVCMGTACQVRGSGMILDRTESKLKIKQGETTADMRFTLKRVNCLGCCAIGPVMVVDDDYHGRVTSDRVERIIKKYD